MCCPLIDNDVTSVAYVILLSLQDRQNVTTVVDIIFTISKISVFTLYLVTKQVFFAFSLEDDYLWCEFSVNNSISHHLVCHQTKTSIALSPSTFVCFNVKCFFHYVKPGLVRDNHRHFSSSFWSDFITLSAMFMAYRRRFNETMFLASIHI
jgi:hypothetical protein